jgi:hypothetical protein
VPFTDASDGHWGAMLTQTHPDRLSLHIPEQEARASSCSQWVLYENQTTMERYSVLLCPRAQRKMDLQLHNNFKFQRPSRV